MTELIQIVDDHDQPIGSAPRAEAWEKGLRYRVVQIIIEDEHGNLLLQKRSADKALYPNRWTNAASGGVDEGESYEATAARELGEEIGVTTELAPLGTFPNEETADGRTVKHFYGVFRGSLSHDTHFIVQPEEVSEVRWFRLDELKSAIEATPGAFTPSLTEIIRRFYS